jgi:transcriptional regulator with XRE-family HTH domain
VGRDGAPTFGQVLKVIRKSAALTQEQLAERSGLHVGAVFKIEQGRREPAWSTVLLLCRALGVSCSAFEGAAVGSVEPPRLGRPKKAGANGEAASAARPKKARGKRK